MKSFLISLCVMLVACGAAGPVSQAQIVDACAVVEGTFTITATGFADPAPTGTVRYKKFPCSNMVFLFLPALLGTSNASTFTAGPLQSDLIPATTFWQEQALDGMDGGSEQNGISVVIKANSNILTFGIKGGDNWTPNSTKGVGLQHIQYDID